MKKLGWGIAALGVAGLGLIWFGWFGNSSRPLGLADRILVEKEARRMSLLRNGEVLKTYRIALGGNPQGHKTEEGDQKTPEGLYHISGRNPESAFHLSLRISYPNDADTAQALPRGVSAGCDIMIHGLPNGTPSEETWRWRRDWTAGCIAVSNSEIEEIWAAVPDGAPIEIRP